MQEVNGKQYILSFGGVDLINVRVLFICSDKKSSLGVVQ